MDISASSRISSREDEFRLAVVDKVDLLFITDVELPDHQLQIVTEMSVSGIVDVEKHGSQIL